MATALRRRGIAVLGGAGYLAVAAQWLVVCVAWFPHFLKSGFGKFVFPAPASQPKPILTPSTTAGASAAPDFITVFLVTVVAVAVIVFVVYLVVVRYTAAISKTGSTVVHKVAKVAAPIIAHKPLADIPTKKRTMLSRRVLFWTKIISAVLPLALLPLVLSTGERGMIEQLALTLQAMLSLFAALCFSVQAALVSRWHVRADQIN